jgi:hypothetical protein
MKILACFGKQWKLVFLEGADDRKERLIGPFMSQTLVVEVFGRSNQPPYL